MKRTDASATYLVDKQYAMLGHAPEAIGRPRPRKKRQRRVAKLRRVVALKRAHQEGSLIDFVGASELSRLLETLPFLSVLQPLERSTPPQNLF